MAVPFLWDHIQVRSGTIAKSQNTYAKRKREMEKKLKAQAKRDAKNKKKVAEIRGTAPGGGGDAPPREYRVPKGIAPENVILDENGMPMKNPFE